MDDPPASAFVAVSELHSPLVGNPVGSTELRSGGDLFVSMPGAPCALKIGASPDGSSTVLDADANELALRTPSTTLRGDSLAVSATKSLSIRAGAADDTVSVAVETADKGIVGTGLATFAAAEHARPTAGSFLTTASEVDGAALVLTTADASGLAVAQIDETSAGSVTYRADEHGFDVSGLRALTVDGDAFVVHGDLEVRGTVTTVNAAASDLRIADPVIQVAADAETEADVRDGVGGVCGVAIETAPDSRGDIERVGAFRDDGGASLFVREGSVDVAAANASNAFAKHFAHAHGRGARESGRRDVTSRAYEPHWDARGGALRITRCVPDQHRAGIVHRYSMVLRVADDGTLEVGKTTTTFRHRPDTAATFEASPPVYRSMLACGP